MHTLIVKAYRGLATNDNDPYSDAYETRLKQPGG